MSGAFGELGSFKCGIARRAPAACSTAPAAPGRGGWRCLLRRASAVAGLVVASRCPGGTRRSVSRDARMKAVDPLPGGLHSTPEQDALALRANDTQAQAALRSGRLLHAADRAEPVGAAGRRLRVRAGGAGAAAAPRSRSSSARPPRPTVRRLCRPRLLCPRRRCRRRGRRRRRSFRSRRRLSIRGGAGHLEADRRSVLAMGRPRAAHRHGSAPDAAGRRAAGRRRPASVADTQRQRRGRITDAGLGRARRERGRVLIPAGRGVYAHPILAVSSDASSPVVLQADSGPIAGDRMIGTFARQNNRLVIHINSVEHRWREDRRGWRGDRAGHDGGGGRLGRGSALPDAVHPARRRGLRGGARSGARHHLQHGRGAQPVRRRRLRRPISTSTSSSASPPAPPPRRSVPLSSQAAPKGRPSRSTPMCRSA